MRISQDATGENQQEPPNDAKDSRIFFTVIKLSFHKFCLVRIFVFKYIDYLKVTVNIYIC